MATMLKCVHHTVYETLPRGGRFYGHCAKCDSDTWLPANVYDDACLAYFDRPRAQIHLTGRRADWDYREFAFEERRG